MAADQATGAGAAPSLGADPEAAEAQRRWDALTDVERTALWVSYWRARAAEQVRHPATGAPLFDDPLSATAAARCVPPAAAAAISERAASEGSPDLRLKWMAVRTAEVDRQVMAAAEALAGAAPAGGTVQVVILGAGLDARAWRLPWPRPAGGRVALWEVDTAPILSLKRHALEGFQVTACTRTEVACDLSDAEALTARLKAAGFDATVPTAWLLEGLIGYFTTDASLRLLQALAALSAPGSRAVITAPPTQRERDESAARGHPLHHSTFEEVATTLERARAAGWDGSIVTEADLEARYGVERAQQVLVLGLRAAV